MEDAVEEAKPAEMETGGDLEIVRELVLRAYPDAVPELIRGESIAEVIGSVEAARAAYARIATSMQQEREESTAPPVVPAGGTNVVIDPDRLPAVEKIRRGIAK